MTYSKPSVELDIHNKIAIITLSNPAHRNAVTKNMWIELISIFHSLRNSKGVRVAILRGEGQDAFSSGADISEFGGQRGGSKQAERYNNLVQDAIDAIATLPIPVVAQIYGFCVGAGTAIAAACDFRYVAENICFGVPAARLGIGYSPNWIRGLMQIVGKPAAAEILLSAKYFTAEKVSRFGFANEIMSVEKLEAFTMMEATSVANNAPLSMAASKICLQQLSVFDDERDWVAALTAARICEESSDYRDAVVAFGNKQEITFSGV